MSARNHVERFFKIIVDVKNYSAKVALLTETTINRRNDMINWKVSKNDMRLIAQIAKRASGMAEMHGINYPVLEADMDITACHANGNPLDLGRFLKADSFNFSHDAMGIRRHINRQTGQLENCFVPRCSKPTQAIAA